MQDNRVKGIALIGMSVSPLLQILHSNTHSQWAKGLQTYLAQQGISARLLRIAQAGDLPSRSVVILLVTPQLLQSAGFRPMIKVINDQGSPIIPVLIRPLPAGMTNPFRQVVDASAQPQHALNQLIAMLGRKGIIPVSRPQRMRLPSTTANRIVILLILFLFGSVVLGMAGLVISTTSQEPPLPTLIALDTNDADEDVAKQFIPDKSDGNSEAEVTETPQPEIEAMAEVDVEVTAEVTQEAEIEVTAEATQEPLGFAGFSVSPQSGDAPLTVTIFNESDGDIVSYSWDFDGDGTVDSTDANPPPYLFEFGGSYPMQLTVTDSNGVDDSHVEMIEVGLSVEEEEYRYIIENPRADLTADFSVTPTEGIAPLTVQFENFSTAELEIVKYQWDFDGNSTTDSTAPVPMPHTFTVPGDYEIRLIITDSDGNRATETHFVYVYDPNERFVPPSDPPIADFDIDIAYGQAPLVVNFTNYSSGDIAFYAWDFNGDGTVDSNAENPSPYTFIQGGDFQPKLIVSTLGGVSDQHSTLITVEPPDPPEADFDLDPSEGEAPLTVQFTDFSYGAITSYAWDFDGNGTTDSTQPNPSYTYNTPGEYEVQLIVSGPGGVSEPIWDYVLVLEPEPPFADFSFTPEEGTAPLSVTFTNLSEGSINSYAWDFDGDGNIDSTVPNPTYIYNEAGDYDVSLTVSGLGGTDTAFDLVIVEDTESDALVAQFTANPTTGTAPLTVTFANLSSGDIQQTSWDFDGDGVGDSPDVNPPPHIYTEVGVYQATLTITDSQGQFESFSTTIEVTESDDPPPQPPIANFTVNSMAGTAPLTITVANLSTGDIVSYAWDFNGDAVVDSDSVTPPPYTYTTVGTHTIALTVTNTQGLSHTTTTTVNVTEAIPTMVDFIASPISGTVPLEVSFTNFSSGNILSYAWDFNGDTVVDSTEVSPSPYVYTIEGNYNATLTVVDQSGVPQSKTQVINVLPIALPDPPVASFVASPISGTSPLAVTFTNTSTGTIVSYAWDFNGDTVVDSTDANPPVHTYTEAGVYTASLTVTDAHNQSTTATATITVTEPPPPPLPVASFTATPLSGNTPLLVTFTNTSTGTIVSYAWDFDGDTVVDSTEANPPAYTYAEAGTFMASLTVTDAHNQSTIATATITVSDAPPPPPIASFTATPLSGNAPLLVTFTNTSTGAITAYAWDFDGDTVVDSMDSNPPAYTYTDAGTYTVSLSVRDAIGQITTATAMITVSDPPPPPPPIASFVASPISGTVPMSVTFTNTSTGSITNYSWDFDGDTVDSTDANPPAYTYTEVGSYTVTLTVQGEGGSHSSSQVITVESVSDEGGDDAGDDESDE